MFKEKINQSLYEKLLISISLCRVESEKNESKEREKLKGWKRLRKGRGRGGESALVVKV